MTEEATELETEAEETEAEEVEEQEEQEQQQAGPSVEALASELGWAPEDQWRGNPDEWVDAATFIRQGRDILKKTLSRQDTELSEVKKTLGEFKEYHQGVEERAYKRAKADLERQRREAVAEGDVEEVDRIQSELDSLPEPSKTEEPDKGNGQANPDNDPNFIAFRSQNPWYGKDYFLTAKANEIAPVVGNAGFQGQAFYDEIARAVRSEFPDKFRNPARARKSSVEGSSGTSRKKGGERGYEDLPPDAKAACDRFVNQGLLTRDEYVKDYDWD